jgi:hypothetical protein
MILKSPNDTWLTGALHVHGWGTGLFGEAFERREGNAKLASAKSYSDIDA